MWSSLVLLYEYTVFDPRKNGNGPASDRAKYVNFPYMYFWRDAKKPAEKRAFFWRRQIDLPLKFTCHTNGDADNSAIFVALDHLVIRV